MVTLGLDRFLGMDFAQWPGQWAIVCNQASINGAARHALDLLPHDRIRCVFGPQHGIWGHTQDNMIEWEGYRDPETGLRFHSLYGETRKPSETMLDGVDHLFFDVPDVGARYYTFIWTLCLCMEACADLGIPVTVLDRPNPIGGTLVEGTVLEPGWESFVGLRPLPMRHGMTVGEIALLYQSVYLPACRLRVIEMRGWARDMKWSATGLPWAMPSPNMPTPDTALVYPGQCLLEGTKQSEGRGTTRPFEIFGAPGLSGRALCRDLNAHVLPGVHFRPIVFEPTFQKHADAAVEGGFIHVTDPDAFRPVRTSLAILRTLNQHGALSWQDPPYEYEYEKRPIDILMGNGWLADTVRSDTHLDEIEDRLREEVAHFHPTREEYLIYR